MDPIKQALHQRCKQEWMKIIVDCRKSGLSDRAYMEQHNIPKGSFYYWLRQIREDLVAQHPDLVRQARNAKETSPVKLVPITMPKNEIVPVNTETAGLVIEFSGAIINVSASTSMDLLGRTLLTVKEALS